jgi:phosphoenolpyruvate carboxylase
MSIVVRTISGDQRRIPATQGTQHPDNATKPAWSHRADARITLEMEGEEALANFRLGIDETMWDNEGKHADYGIGLKLVEQHNDFFTERQLGRDLYITYRIPNRWKQRGGVHRHVFTAIAAENETLASYGFHERAFFEVILPFTEDAFQLLGVQMDYVLNNGGRRLPEHLEIIPLIEGPDRLGDVRGILDGYVRGMKRIFGIDLTYVRPFTARSDPAMDSGLVCADLFAIGAASEYERYARDSGVACYPIIGAGSCTFRGGLAPDAVETFVQKYPGYRTATVQSAFRYDYPEELVREGIQCLAERLPETEARVLDDVEMAFIYELMGIFSRPYKAIVTRQEDGRIPVAETIVEIADKFIPSNRERAGHVGTFGYGRDLGGTAVNLPRAIKYCAAFMTLGIPPELIGLHDGLNETRTRGLMPAMERLLPHLQSDIARALRYVDVEVLDRLSCKSEAWAAIRADVTAAAEYTGETPGPRSADESRHLNYTRAFAGLYESFDGDPEMAAEMTEAAVKAAVRRRYLG